MTRSNTQHKAVFKARTEIWGESLKPDLRSFSPLNNLVVVVCVHLEIIIFIWICLCHFHWFLPRTYIFGSLIQGSFSVIFLLITLFATILASSQEHF